MIEAHADDCKVMLTMTFSLGFLCSLTLKNKSRSNISKACLLRCQDVLYTGRKHDSCIPVLPLQTYIECNMVWFLGKIIAYPSFEPDLIVFCVTQMLSIYTTTQFCGIQVSCLGGCLTLTNS